jgi:hypothetical protein
MSARDGRRAGIVFFESQRVVEPPHRSWAAIAAALLVVASLVAVGLWRLLLSR